MEWEKGCEGRIECGGRRDRRGKDDTMELGGKGWEGMGEAACLSTKPFTSHCCTISTTLLN